jgi:hypothetical protein
MLANVDAGAYCRYCDRCSPMSLQSRTAGTATDARQCRCGRVLQVLRPMLANVDAGAYCRYCDRCSPMSMQSLRGSRTRRASRALVAKRTMCPSISRVRPEPATSGQRPTRLRGRRASGSRGPRRRHCSASQCFAAAQTAGRNCPRGRRRPHHPTASATSTRAPASSTVVVPTGRSNDRRTTETARH